MLVVCITELKFGTRHPEEFLPEVTDENWAPITNNGLEHSMENAFMNFSATFFVVKGWRKVRKCVDLLSLSTITMMVSLPCETGNPSIKSKVMSFHTWHGIYNG